MDETEELIELSVQALAAQMIAAPGVELHMVRSGVLGLTDEPLTDFNRLILGDGPEAEGFLVRSAAPPLEALHVTDAIALSKAAATGFSVPPLFATAIATAPDGASILTRA